MDFAQTTMLITGASQGIGRHLAVHFAECGANVYITARHEEGLRETAQRVQDAVRRRCAYFVSDLRRPDTLEGLVDWVQSEAGRVDVLINNAADVTSKEFLNTTLEEIDGLIRTNVTGCLQLCRLLVPEMIPCGGGMIVNISSLAGYKTNPGQTVYSISKAAVNAISESLRVELSDKGIHVMNVALSSVAAGYTPKSGQMPVAQFARILERAMQRRTKELYLSPLTKWLMRLYHFYPPLSRLRKTRPH